jgi:hypothetical protein
MFRHGGGLGGERGAWSFLKDDLCVGEGVPGGYGRWGAHWHHRGKIVRSV